MAITGGRIEALAARPCLGLNATGWSTCAAATLVPGFIDAHNDMTGFGMSLAEVDLRSPPIGSLDELYAAISRRAEATAPGSGWWGRVTSSTSGAPIRTGTRWTGRRRNRRVWLRHTSGHMRAVNGLVLADLGLDAAAIDAPGGRVATTRTAGPAGCSRSRAQTLAGTLRSTPYRWPSVPPPSTGPEHSTWPKALPAAPRPASAWPWVSHSPVELAAYTAARDQGLVARPGRADGRRRGPGRPAAHPDDGLTLGLDLGIRTVSATTGSGSARSRSSPTGPWSGAPLLSTTIRGPGRGRRGYLQADAADLQATIIAAHRSGWQVATHAIGDRAIDVVLDAYARVLEQFPRRDPRHRIEHFAVVRPRQVAQAAGLGAIAVPQGRFAAELGDGMLAAVGPGRHDWLYRQRSLLAAGMVLPGSLDWPVVTGAPLLGIGDMVARRTAWARRSTPVRRSPCRRPCTPTPPDRPTPAGRSTSRARSRRESSPTSRCCRKIRPRSARTASPACRRSRP